MNNNVEQLISVLDKELAMHRLLIDAAREMNEALKIHAVPQIQAAGRHYDEYTCGIAELEEKRLQLSDEICRGRTPAMRHANLLAVADAEDVPGTQKTAIIALRTKLRQAIMELSGVNYSNETLLKDALYGIAKTFDMIAALSVQGIQGYKSRGTKDMKKPSISIVNTVA